MSVDVGVWVLDFAEFVEDAWGQGIHLRDKFEQFVVGEVFQREFPKKFVSNICDKGYSNR